MKHPCTRLSVFFVAAFSLLCISASYVRAQPPSRVLAPRLETLETVRDRMRRENNPTDYDPMAERGNPFDLYRRRALELRLARAAQVRKDTERIQFFNTEMMRSVSTSAPLDYDRIVKTTGEIKKRASRLMLNLNLPKLEKSEKTEAGPELFDNPALAASLKKLDGLVRQFGASPLLRLGRVGVLDVKAVTDARRNLGDVIVLSDKIRNSARLLARTARQ